MDNNEARTARYINIVARMTNAELVEAYGAAQKAFATAEFGSDLWDAQRIMSGILQTALLTRLG